MTSKWDFYQCSVNGKPASIYLDLALHGAAPDLKRSLLLIVWLDLRLPDPDHLLSTDAEFDALAAIEDRLANAFKAAYRCTYAGRITTDARREFYFYGAASDQMEALVLTALAPFPGLRWMKDKGVVEALATSGDTPAIARAVSHVSYFASDARRTAFAQSIEHAGFRIGKLLDKRRADEPHPFGVAYQLMQTPTLAVMTQTTTLLSKLSEKNGGQYDGWECKAVGPNAKRWWRLVG